MRIIFFSLFSFFFLSAQESQQEVNFSVNKAVVYQNSAHLFTTSKVQLKEGNNQIIIKGVSQNINTSSIVIGGLRDASINQINYSTDYLLIPEKQKALQAVEEKLAEVYLEKNKLTNTNNALETEKELLQKNQLIASQENNSSLEKLKSYAQYYRTRFEEINNKQYSIKLQLEELIAQQNALQKQKNQLENQVTENRGIISINLFSKATTSTQLKLNYQVYNAGWKPAYELRAADASQPLSFLYQAEVYQHTGIDWKGVDLYLSTGSPRNNIHAPSLNPLFLNFLSPIKHTRSSNDDLSEVVVVGYGSLKEASSPPPNYNGKASRSETQASIVFHLGENHQLLSSPNTTKHLIEQKNIPARFVYEVVPVITKDVFLKAYISDWQDLDLVSGEAKLYLGETYAGSTQIVTDVLEEELAISFGIDETIVVERKEVNSNQSKTFFRNQTILAKRYTIAVMNTKSSSINISIQDRIPVAQNSDIKVEDIQFGPGELEEETGIITWEASIQPKQKWNTELSFSVKYPKDKKVNFR